MRKKITPLILLIIFSLGITLIVFICGFYNEISVVKYRVDMDINEQIRIVHLTDLHNREFGEDNRELVSRIEELQPDVIIMTGDMINKDENLDIICNLLEQLVDIAPVYYGYGDDEINWELGEQEELVQCLQESGAHVLNFSYEDIDIKGQNIRIGDYYGYYRVPHMRTDDIEEQEAERLYADQFEDTDSIKILLSHIPTSWLDWGYIDKYPIDLVFCGHYHGGQIRLPLIGGLYAPYVGWFPEYTQGVFEGEQATCILSTGLGNDAIVPRMNNRPEVVVVDLIPQE